MFAITGITGQVGSIVARRLLDSGHQVRAVVRSSAKAAEWRDRGAEVAVADLLDSDALAKAFSGVDGVFVLLPPIFDPSPGFTEAQALIKSLRTALERARPAKVVALSTIGADAAQPNLLYGLRLMEQSFASLDMPLTFLRAAWFMENAAWDVSSAQVGVIHSYLQPLERAIAMISVADVGRTAAELLTETWTGHRVVELEGAERVSPQRLAAAFSKAIGREVRAQIVPRAQWQELFRAQGMKNPLPRVQMIDGFNDGWIDFTGLNADARKGRIGIDEAVLELVAGKKS